MKRLLFFYLACFSLAGCSVDTSTDERLIENHIHSTLNVGPVKSTLHGIAISGNNELSVFAAFRISKEDALNLMNRERDVAKDVNPDIKQLQSVYERFSNHGEFRSTDFKFFEKASNISSENWNIAIRESDGLVIFCYSDGF